MWLSGAEVTGVGGSGQVQCVQKVKGRRVQGRAALLMGVEDKAGQVWAASGCLLGAGSESQALPRRVSAELLRCSGLSKD